MDLIRLPSLDEFLFEAELDKEFSDFIKLCEARGRNPVIEGKPRKSEIKKAIRERNYVGIYYEEPDPDQDGKVLAGFRLIEPYVYGKGYKYGSTITHDKREYLRCFVIRDTKSDSQFKDKKNITRRKSVSKSKRVPYWRLMRVDRIQTWQNIKRKVLGYRDGYNPNDESIANILAAADTSEFSKGSVPTR